MSALIIQLRAWHTWVECRNALLNAQQAQGLTVADVASRTGYTDVKVGNVLSGRGRLSVSSFIAICEALSLDAGAILTKARAAAAGIEPTNAL